MKLLFFIIILCIFIYFHKEGFVEQTETLLKNIYGEPLKPCRKGFDTKGSWDNDGFCSEEGGGVHQICFNVTDETDNFSSLTGQGDWSKSRNGKTHCMCLGAWALYKAKQARNKDIKKTDNELVCEAIPEMALEERYINKWNTWNKIGLNNQIKEGVISLYEQCSKKANPQQKKFLDDKYELLQPYL